MNGYVARKGNRWYAVIYEGLDPVTGRERRSWHPAGTSRADAEQLAARLAADRNGRNDASRALTFGAYLITRWLPAKRALLADSSYAGYKGNVNRHILPTLGSMGLRRLRPEHLEAFYDKLQHDPAGPHLAPKTVYEIHLVVRGALDDATRRGLVARNVAHVARAPRLGAIPRVEQRAWTIDELQAFLRAASGRAGVRIIRLHDLRHTHGTLLIASGVPVKVVSERLGHAKPAFTIDTYQHVLPGMQADAARVFEELVAPGLLPMDASREKNRKKPQQKTA